MLVSRNLPCRRGRFDKSSFDGYVAVVREVLGFVVVGVL